MTGQNPQHNEHIVEQANVLNAAFEENNQMLLLWYLKPILLRLDKISCQEKEVLYECIRCDETKTEIIRRENHNKVYTVVTEATCTEFGLHHIECTDCDFVDDSITPPRCKPGEYTVTKKPGIFTEGEEKTNCTVCGKKLTRSIWPIGTSESSPYEMKADEF